jgi:hypothetical protein
VLLFDLPSAAAACPPESSLAQVFPSADVLPSNLLRFHLRFARTVEVFDVNEHLRLVDTSEGAEQIVAHPFLDLSDGLWSADGLTLTVLLHPGRVKLGLASHEARGAALLTSRSYELQMRSEIDLEDIVASKNEWRTLKRFLVSEALDNSMDVTGFAVEAPRADTRAPLRLNLKRVVDRLAIENYVAVTDENGAIVPIDVVTSRSDMTILLRPLNPWRVGTYTVHFANEFEDVSGNRFSASFESQSIVPFTQTTTRLVASITNDAPHDFHL